MLETIYKEKRDIVALNENVETTKKILLEKLGQEQYNILTTLDFFIEKDYTFPDWFQKIVNPETEREPKRTRLKY